jgi:hypothetical protein
MNIRSTLLFSLCLILMANESDGQVTPLLSTTWNQGCYYNAQCPTTGSGGACGRVWTGCNATAIAQIFKYYSYPSTGMGNHCNTNDMSHCVDFSVQTYNYAAMPNNVTSSNPEVAKLMYHLGIAVNMQWSGSSSNSFFDATPFKKFFKYSPRIYSTATFMFNTTQDLIDAIKAELNAGRPVYAKGGSHFYLIDGYNLSDQFHMNFGWGGTYDGYYSINNVVNGAGTFNPSNFIFNIKPLQGDLETAIDTIFITANGAVNQNLEFTSLLNWNASTDVSWISLNMPSGNMGFYNLNNGSTFNCSVNNDNVRFGYIYINNGNDIDTVVVKQDASPLTTSPANLSFSEAGGNQNILVSYLNFGNWTATTPDSWLSLAPASGTGNGTIVVTCSPNVLPSPRNGMVIINAGVYADTILINQDASTSTFISENNDNENIFIFPNPANDILHINISGTYQPTFVEIYDLNGKTLWSQNLQSDINSFPISQLQNGVYLINIRTSEKNTIRKFTVLR